jgi:hypothetical protein
MDKADNLGAGLDKQFQPNLEQTHVAGQQFNISFGVIGGCNIQGKYDSFFAWFHHQDLWSL